MATMEVTQAMENAAFERDQQEFALGDTLDIKTGLILAALTFLAIQSGDLMKSSGVTHVEVFAALRGASRVSSGSVEWVAQFVSVMGMIVGGVFSVLVLMPRDYDREPPPHKYRAWVTETEEYREKYPDENVPPVTAERLLAWRTENAISNINRNAALNRLKSNLMFVAFACTVVAFGANILTLATRLF